MSQRITLFLFMLTLFLSATVMFGVQPMVGKMLLPIVGGMPSGWIVALAFFQAMLLLGYLLAHLLSRLSPSGHALGYLACLGLGAFFLPISLQGGDVATPGAWDVFKLLTFGVGAPFIALSATSSTIQRLFTHAGHALHSDPYFLYKASNLGSFAGLLLYPLLLGPNLTLGLQSKAATAGYAGVALLGAACLLAVARHVKNAKAAAAPLKTRPPGWRLRLQWLALSFLPSSLLLGVTTYMTTDLIAAPMIWVLPLAVYLLTFVIAFSKKPFVSLETIQSLHPVAVCVAVFCISLMQASWLGTWAGVAFYLLIFGIVALACHMRLASLRPLEGESRHLTEFYLMMSLGGALGGALNAFIIPNVFNRIIEFPLMMLASLLVHPAVKASSKGGKGFIAILLFATLSVNLQPYMPTLTTARIYLTYGVLAGLLVIAPLFYPQIFRTFRIAFIALVIFVVSQCLISDLKYTAGMRGFFGTLRVFEEPVADDGRTYIYRKVQHDFTVHGGQVIDPKLETEPTSYYARKGPLDDIFASYAPRRVAAIGLGAGIVACYAAPHRDFTFFEINPDMEKLARENFTFLAKCAPEAPVQIGDGRLELAKRQKEKFDLIILDAFVSDAIPTHLLTKEAFALYAARLTPEGVIAVHISNRYFHLWDMITVTARTLGLDTRLRFRGPEGLPFYASPSLWMTVGSAKKMTQLDKKGWHKVNPRATVRPWTDDYTDLLDMLFAKPSGIEKTSGENLNRNVK